MDAKYRICHSLGKAGVVPAHHERRAEDAEVVGASKGPQDLGRLLQEVDALDLLCRGPPH